MKLLLEVMLWIIGIPAAIILSIGLAAVAYIAIMYALYGIAVLLERLTRR